MMGLSRVEWVVDDSCGQEDPLRNGASGSLSLKQQEESEWQKQTLKQYDVLNHVLYRYLRGLGLSIDAAEDVVQESFLRLAQHLREGGNTTNVRSWIFQVAHNLSMDIHRAARRDRSDSDIERLADKELIDPKGNPEWVYLQNEKEKYLTAAMLRLTTQQRSSVLLRSEGLRYREIASVLGVSEQRAIHLVKRALVRLAGEL
jgi:RNA polymerase sigma-70 factor (ECF subfamily)